MTILITLWFLGYNITIDANQMYDITTLIECKRILPRVKNSWGSTNGVCFKGNIIKDIVTDA